MSKKIMKAIPTMIVAVAASGCVTIHNKVMTDSEADSTIIQAASGDGRSMVGGVLGGIAGMVLNFKKDPKMKCTNGLGQRVDCDTGEPVSTEKPADK